MTTKDWFNKGVNLSYEGKRQEALKAFETAIALDEKDSRSWNGKGNALHSLGLHDDALKAYSNAIALDKNDALPWHSMGIMLEYLGKFEEALKAYSNAIALDEKFAPAWNGRGNVFNSLDRFEDALQDFNTAIALDEKFALPWNGRGNALYSLGWFEEAVKAYDKAISLNKNDSLPWNGRGNALHRLGRDEDALKSHDTAISMNEKLAPAWNGRGNALHSQGKFEEALEAFDTAIALDEKLTPAWNGRGNALDSLGRYEEALKAFNTAIALDENFAPAWWGRGLIHFKKEHFPLAQSCFLRFYHLGTGGFLNQVIADFIKFFDSSFSAPLFMHRFFKHHPCLQIYSMAARLIETTAEQCAGVLKLLTYLNSRASKLAHLEKLKIEGLIYQHMGDPMRAKEVFDEVNMQDETDLLGQYYRVASMNDYLEPFDEELNFAKDKAKTFLQSNPESPEPRQPYYAGQIFYLAGDLEKACQCFRLTPDFLPSLYMEMRVLHQQENFPECANVINKIEVLKKQAPEQLPYMQGTVPANIDLTQPGWEQHFYSYAHAVEISAAFLELDILEHELDILKSKPQVPISAYINWLLDEKSQQLIENLLAAYFQDQLQLLRKEIEKVITKLPFALDEKIDPDRAERELGAMIEDKDLSGQMENYRQLVKYCLYTGNLSLPGAMVLDVYISFKELLYKKNVLKEIGGGAFEATGVAAISFVLTDPFVPPEVSFQMQLLITAGGSGLGQLILNFTKHCAKRQKLEISTYIQFKKLFLDFVKEQRGELGDKFEEVYPLKNFKKWAEKK